ncbi:pentatricopeptide repeat-containing protein At3g22150, chloroplastic [Phalaenopsis equestris]|uniref:pentatricopeptide repeat-containing protein At3g22150, chloroplastic n=1 Tax=Phalaenopsis equestris TaxID=78828 RepID=UPI0009E54D03|nr:pentatricopeptide repeat-containing protein At3g22150, chloroplastic [Phalaenopsis equestris]
MTQYWVQAIRLPPPLHPHSCSKPLFSVGFPPRNSSSPPSLTPPAAELSRPLDPDLENPNRSGRSNALRSRLSQLCKEGRIELARRLFDALPRPIPTILWNAILIGYVCNSYPDDALRLYQLMNSDSDARSDHYTYSSVLKACADSRRLRLGQSLHCRILRCSPTTPTNRVLNNSLLNMYASALDTHHLLVVDAVRLLFDRMPKKNVVSWNTLIGWYVRSGRPAIALDQFRRMVEAGIRPSPVSFVNVFPATVSAASVKGSNYWPDLLFGMLIKFGIDYVANVFVLSSAIFIYSERSDIQSARLIFDCAVEKNVQVWNTMIGGYVQNACYEEALALFLQVLESDEVVADDVTFLASLMAISQLQDDGLGRQVHAYLIKENSKALPLILNNALMVMYSRCDDVKSAFDVFGLMLERDIVSWNTMISAFVQKDLNFEGLRLVHEMHKAGLIADSVTVTALLSAASNLGSLSVGKETHGYLIRQGIEFEGMLSYLIDMYAKSGCVETAGRIFDANDCDERDQVTWNAMIAGYMHNENLDRALSLFRNMLGRNCLPNHVTISLILPACDPIEGIQAGKQIHGFAIRQHLDTNVFVGTAIIDMYSKCGGIISADKVFNFMKEKNRVTYTTMLSGFGQHGLGERALSLFEDMQSLGIKPDAVTFVAIISACSYSGLIDEGLAVFESMEAFGIVATTEHYCCVVDLLGRAGRVEKAYEFVRYLGESGNQVGIWGSLLAACKLHGKYELGKLVSRRLFDMENQNENGSAGYHVLMSNVYAEEGRWDGVRRLRQEMKGRGLMKEPGSSWIEVRDASHRFMSRDKDHPESDRIHAMLDGLASDMRSSAEKNDGFTLTYDL